MRCRRFSRALAALLGLGALAGCGLAVPEIKEVWDGPDGTRQLEFEIKRRVYCDLKQAVRTVDTQMQYQTEDRNTHQVTSHPILPDEWGAQVSIVLQVDEFSSFNPGIALTHPFANAPTKFGNGTVTTPQSFSLGLGGTVSSTATRIDKFDPFYTVGFLRQPETEQSACRAKNDPFLANGEHPASSSFILQSDLGIDKWLLDGMFTNLLLSSDKPLASPNKDAPDTVSIDIKFVVVTNANINPVWKLLPITANNGTAALLSSGRTRTHDLLITIGPPGRTTTDTHFAGQINQAINNLTRSSP
jgi:hypothetical protein